LPLAWRGWKERTSDRFADRASNLAGRDARSLVEWDFVLREAPADVQK
jgi:hypothetical protein